MKFAIAWLVGVQTGATVMGSILHKPMALPIVATVAFNLMALIVCSALSMRRGARQS